MRLPCLLAMVFLLARVNCRLEAQTGSFSVAPMSLQFTSVQGAPTLNSNLAVFSQASGVIKYSVQASSEGNWLTVSPSTGSVSPGTPAFIAVSAVPGNLLAGVYQGSITIGSAGESQTVSLLLTLTAAERKLLISPTGLTFFGIAASGRPLPQSFGILNVGLESLNWTVQAASPSGDATPWLTVSPLNGTVARPYLDVSTVNVQVDPGALPVGDYYAQLQVSSEGADNSPETVIVHFVVLPPGSLLPPEARPSGLIFTGDEGVSPSSQKFQIAIPGLEPLQYNSAVVTGDGQNWLTVDPSNGTVYPNQPLPTNVLVDYSSLRPSILTGAVTLQFSGGQVSIVQVLSVVAPGPAMGAAVAHQAGGCVPTVMKMQLTNAQDLMIVNVGQAVPLEMRIVDGCGVPVTSANASTSVTVSFSNGDPGINMIDASNGNWTQTWQPMSPANPTTISFTAFAVFSNGNFLADQTDATVDVGVASNTPIVSQGAVINAASFARNVPLAPGTLVSIFGSNLADGTAQAKSVPLGTVLAHAQVTLRDRLLPLLYASNGQINAQIPFDIPVNTELELIVGRDEMASVPQAVIVAAAQPAVFTKDQSGSGPGVIVDGVTNTMNSPQSPAKAGDIVVIYCTGLGTVTPPVPSGGAATGKTPTDNPATVTIGGKNAIVNYAGLTPGSVGLYQVNAIVPSGVQAGDAVSVVVTVAGQQSQPVTMSVK